jgi:hypothetical protein
MLSRCLIISSKPSEDPHELCYFQLLVITGPAFGPEDEERIKGFQDDKFRVLSGFLDRDSAEKELERLTNERAREYTDIIWQLPDFSAVKERPFLVHLGEEITHFPGAYQMKADVYFKLLVEFGFDDIYLADKNEPIRPIIMAKDIERLRSLQLPFGSYFGVAKVVDPEFLEEVYTVGAKVMKLVDQVMAQCRRVVLKDDLAKREDAVARLATIMDPNEAETFVQGTIEWYESDADDKLPVSLKLQVPAISLESITLTI